MEYEKAVRVYLDNCCYNRPFDDQTQLLVRLETEAKLEIQSRMRLGVLEYVWSDMLIGEVMDSPFDDQRDKILPWCAGASAYVHVTPEIEARADEFMARGVKSSDAIHLACAEAAGCDWFFTVDRGILRKIRTVGEMRVENPMAYIQEEE